MAMFAHEGAVASDGLVFFAVPDDGIALPSLLVSGPVRVEDGRFKQDVELGAPPAGYVWRLGLSGGPFLPAVTGTADLGPLTGSRGSLIAFLSNSASFSRPVEPHPPLTFPEGAIPVPPVLLGSIGNVQDAVGSSVTVDAGPLVDGSSLIWSATVDGSPLPSGWSITQDGVLAVGTAVAGVYAVVVRAANAAGAVLLLFTARIDFEAPRLVGTLADVSASVGDIVQVDFGGIVVGGALTYTMSNAWPISAAGVITVPTETAITETATATATDNLNRTASASFTATISTTASQPGPQVIATPSAVVATVGDTQGNIVTVQGATFITGGLAPLVWSEIGPGTINANSGVLTISTAAPVATIAQSITCTDSLGRIASVSFSVTVSAAAATPTMTVTTNPTISATGTGIGGVVSIGGGVYAGGVAPFTTERRFLRNGVEIAPYAVNASHTIVAADQGKTITGQVRRTDSRTPTADVLTVTATGAIAVPAAPGVGTADVNNSAQLAAAWDAAMVLGGVQTIRLGPGPYTATLTRTNQTKVGSGTALGANRLILIANDRNDPPRFTATNAFDFRSVSGWTFDGLLGDCAARETVLGKQWPLTSSTWFLMTNGGSGNNASPHCKDWTIRNCVVRNYHVTMRINKATNELIEWCRFERCGMDTLKHQDLCRNVLVQNNIFTDPFVDTDRAQDAARHPDYLSMQVPGTQTVGVEGVMIRRNFFSGLDFYHQGIFASNDPVTNGGASLAIQHKDVTIEDNWLIMAHVNALFVSGTRNMLVRRNVIQEFPPGFGNGGWSGALTKGKAGLTIKGRSSGTVSDNLTAYAVANADAVNDGIGPTLTYPRNTVSKTPNDGNVPTSFPRVGGVPKPFPNGPYGYE